MLRYGYRLALGTMVKYNVDLPSQEETVKLFMIVGTWSWKNTAHGANCDSWYSTRVHEIGDDPQSSDHSSGYLLMMCGTCEFVQTAFSTSALEAIM